MLGSEAACWWRPLRTVDAATVLHVDLSENPARESTALGWLDESERERLRRFLFDGPRRRFALCRAALRATLCNRLGCDNERLSIETTEHGKPFALVDGNRAAISFNASHSGRHGLIALSPEGRIGIDVEERTEHRNMDLLIEGVFSPAEQAALALTKGYDKTLLFFRFWTIKESIIKAHGSGFTLDVSAFELPSNMLRGATRATILLPMVPQVTWQVEDLATERFAAAIAYEVSQE